MAIAKSKMDEEEKFAGLSDTVSRIIEAILGALVIISTVLTTYVSPYYTISIATTLVITLVVFLSLKNRNSTTRYEAKLKQELEIERSRQWNESNKPLLTESANIGSVRNAKLGMCQAIIMAFQESMKDSAISEDEKKVLGKVIQRIQDMEKAVTFS